MLYVCVRVLFVNVSFWEVRRSNLTPREKNTSPLFRVFVRIDEGKDVALWRRAVCLFAARGHR